jgi:radical SAM protein with 4Fe4S-binding SPASM domain
MGVDLIGTVHAFGLFDSDRSEAIYTTPARQGKINNDYSNFIKEAQNVAKKGNSKLYLPPLKPSEPRLDCSFSARQLPIIDPSGDVYPCCVLQALGNEKGTSVRPMGNIYLESLPDIWNSSSYSQFREAFYTGHLPSQSCEKCPKYYSL